MAVTINAYPNVYNDYTGAQAGTEVGMAKISLTCEKVGTKYKITSMSVSAYSGWASGSSVTGYSFFSASSTDYFKKFCIKYKYNNNINTISSPMTIEVSSSGTPKVSYVGW